MNKPRHFSALSILFSFVSNLALGCPEMSVNIQAVKEGDTPFASGLKIRATASSYTMTTADGVVYKVTQNRRWTLKPGESLESLPNRKPMTTTEHDRKMDITWSTCIESENLNGGKPVCASGPARIGEEFAEIKANAISAGGGMAIIGIKDKEGRVVAGWKTMIPPIGSGTILENATPTPASDAYQWSNRSIEATLYNQLSRKIGPRHDINLPSSSNHMDTSALRAAGFDPAKYEMKYESVFNFVEGRVQQGEGLRDATAISPIKGKVRIHNVQDMGVADTRPAPAEVTAPIYNGRWETRKVQGCDAVLKPEGEVEPKVPRQRQRPGSEYDFADIAEPSRDIIHN